MTDKRDEEWAAKRRQSGPEDGGTASGAGYGDHAEEQKDDDGEGAGEEKSG